MLWALHNTFSLSLQIAAMAAAGNIVGMRRLLVSMLGRAQALLCRLTMKETVWVCVGFMMVHCTALL